MTELYLCFLWDFLFEFFESRNACDHIAEKLLSHCGLDIFVGKNFFLLFELFRFPIPISLWIVISIFIIVFNVHVIVIWRWLFMDLALFLWFYQLIILFLGFPEDSLLTLIGNLSFYFLQDFSNVLSLFNALIILYMELFYWSLSAYRFECFDN